MLFVLVFLHSFQQCHHLAWGRGSCSVCFSCICLFVLNVLVFVIFLFLLLSGVGCGLWLWHSLDLSINFFEEKKKNTLYTEHPIKHWNYMYVNVSKLLMQVVKHCNHTLYFSFLKYFSIKSLRYPTPVFVLSKPTAYESQTVWVYGLTVWVYNVRSDRKSIHNTVRNVLAEYHMVRNIYMYTTM